MSLVAVRQLFAGEIEKLKLMRRGWFVFGLLDVDAPNPVTAINKILR